jgi:hypothetical protein
LALQGKAGRGWRILHNEGDIRNTYSPYNVIRSITESRGLRKGHVACTEGTRILRIMLKAWPEAYIQRCVDARIILKRI